MIDIQSNNGNSKLFLLTLLGMLTAFGPFVTDMYLPSLPSMGDYFRTPTSWLQLALSDSMIGLAPGHTLFVLIIVRHGPRSQVLAAVHIFILATIG